MFAGQAEHSPHASAFSLVRAWSVLWRTALRTLVALACAQLVTFGASYLWNKGSYALIPYLYSSQFTRDTMALAAPLAGRSVAVGALVLSLLPLLLAAWSARHTMLHRIFAALAGFSGGVLTTVAGQTLISFYTGYAFTLRHAVPNPASSFDWASLGAGCLFGLWAAFQVVPLRPR